MVAHEHRHLCITLQHYMKVSLVLKWASGPNLQHNLFILVSHARCYICLFLCQKNAILDGCSTKGYKWDGIGWIGYLRVG